MTDEKIVQDICRGNKNLYAEIIKRYQSKLLRYALYLTGDEHESADVVQEAFIKAYINLNGFDVKKKFSSWIYRIVHNEAINFINKQKKQIKIDENFDFDSGIDLEDNTIRKELTEHARACLDQMPVIYKEPLELYFLEEKNYEEISDILMVPINTVGTRISRAKILMRKICQKLI